jgi:hypothetical protein
LLQKFLKDRTDKIPKERVAIRLLVFSLTDISRIRYTPYKSDTGIIMKIISFTLSLILICSFCLFAKEYTLGTAKVTFTEQPEWNIEASPSKITIRITEEKKDAVVITLTTETLAQDSTALGIVEKAAAGQTEIMKEEVKGAKLEISGAEFIGTGLYVSNKTDPDAMQYGYAVFCKGKNAVKIVIMASESNFEKQMNAIDSFLDSIRVK